MGHIWSILIVVAFFAFPAGAETKVGVWSEKVNRAWWAEHPNPEDWIAERASIHEQLLAVHNRLGTSEAIANKNFTGWMALLKWLTLFPDDWEGHDFYQDEAARETYRSLAIRSSLRNAFLDVLSPYDNHEKALEILCRIHGAHPEGLKQYPSLAIALAIVFDQEFPVAWPHHFVNPSSVPRVEEKPEDRFAFFVASQKAGALMYELDSLTIEMLKYVVDTPVSINELKYVQGVKMRAIKQFHTLFQMIDYDMARLKRGAYIWPHGRYALGTIAKEGGLCVDQAYYTSHAAKAKGVPNIVFLGQGNSGEHAWIGYLETATRWRFDLAKFQNEDYPVGQAFDPQTWRRLTDSECEFLNRRSTSAATNRKARQFMIWAELNPEDPSRLEAFRQARKTSSEYLWAWESEAACLEESGAAPEELIRFWNDWIRAFKSQSDLCFRGEKRLLNLLEEAGHTSEYNRLLKEVISSNKNQRSDLVVSLAGERVFVHIENKRWEEAHKTFRGAMQKLASKAGGHLFYQLIQPYVLSCLEEGQGEQAAEAMERAQRAFEAQPGSILDKDLKDLGALVRAKGDL